MTTIKSEEARARFAEIVNRAAYANERTIITKHGKRVAAVVSMADLELLEHVLARLEDEVDLQAATAALKEVETTGTTPWDKIKADLGL